MSRLADSNVIPSLASPSAYRDRSARVSDNQWLQDLSKSTTVYVGNLSFYTTEEQVHELFGKCGEIKRIIMGLDRFKKTPCGFCFVEYYNHEDALDCMKFVNGTRLDDRIVRSDLDPGFKEGRQFGRGRSGGQVRDEYREDYDAGRGGWGALQERLDRERHRRQERDYVPIEHIPAGASLQYSPRSAKPSRKRRNDMDEDDDNVDQAPSKIAAPADSDNNPRFREHKAEDE